MTDRLHTRDQADVRVITLDDGKVNVMSLAMLRAIDAELARGEAEGRALVITGRAQVLSAGFDLATLRAGGADALAMLEAGARLARRLLAYPAPLVVAVNGAAMAMGAFVVLGADVRLGTTAPALKLAANEVAVGLTMPRFATALLRHRLTPAAFDLAAITARPFTGDDTIAAGWLHARIDDTALLGHAIDIAAQLAALDRSSYTATKLSIRARALAEMDDAIAADVEDWQTRIAR